MQICVAGFFKYSATGKELYTVSCKISIHHAILITGGYILVLTGT